MSNENKITSVLKSLSTDNEVIVREVINEVKTTTTRSKKLSKKQLESKLLREQIEQLERQVKQRVYNYSKHVLFNPNNSLFIMPNLNKGSRNNNSYENYFQLFHIYKITDSIFENIYAHFNDSTFVQYMGRILHYSLVNEVFIDEIQYLKFTNKTTGKDELIDKDGQWKKNFRKGISNYVIIDGTQKLGKYDINNKVENGILKELLEYNVIKFVDNKIVVVLDKENKTTLKPKELSLFKLLTEKQVQDGVVVISKSNGKVVQKILYEEKTRKLMEFLIKELKLELSFEDFVKYAITSYKCNYVQCKCS